MNERTNKSTNIQMDERKDENYIPLGINGGGTFVYTSNVLLKEITCDA